VGSIAGGFTIQSSVPPCESPLEAGSMAHEFGSKEKPLSLFGNPPAVLRDICESLELAVSIVSSCAPLQLFFQDRSSKKPQKKPLPLGKMPEPCCSLASSCQHRSNICPAPGTGGKMRDTREESSSGDSTWPKSDASGQETRQWIPLWFGLPRSPRLQHPIADRAVCTHRSFQTCSITEMRVALERSTTANSSSSFTGLQRRLSPENLWGPYLRSPPSRSQILRLWVKEKQVQPKSL